MKCWGVWRRAGGGPLLLSHGGRKNTESQEESGKEMLTSLCIKSLLVTDGTLNLNHAENVHCLDENNIVKGMLPKL